MSNILKVTKYQLRDFRNSLVIFYLVIIALGILLVVLNSNSENMGNSSFGGATVIFIFILGLNSFKNSFKFMQANNISRRRFYLGNIVAIVSVSAFMAIVDITFNNIFSALVPYRGLFQQLYGGNTAFADLLWSFSLFALATSLGWLITMLYYRCNVIMKIMISILPVFLIILLNYLDRIAEGSVYAISRFIRAAFGLTSNINPYSAVLSFIVCTVVILLLCYPLIYKAPIKD